MIELIKQHLEKFKDTVEYRLTTSPNPYHHIEMLCALELEDWVKVDSLVNTIGYQRQFEGVVICLNHNQDDEFTQTHLEILEVWYAKMCN